MYLSYSPCERMAIFLLTHFPKPSFMSKLYSLQWLFMLLLIFSVAPLLKATTITVTNSNDSGDGSLRRAASNASAGDTILFATSTNGTPIVLDEAFIPLETDLTIIGNGMSQTIVDGDGSSRIFSVRNNATVKLMGMTIRNGTALNMGGGIRVRSGATLMMRNMQVRDCASVGSTATMGGGGISNEGTLIMTRCLITGNTATVGSGSGGGILNGPDASLEVYFSSITDNTANRAGGGIEDASGGSTTVMVNRSMIMNNVVNTSPGNGGGIHIGGTGNLTISQSFVTGNVAGAEGGGIWNGFGTLTVDATQIDDNEAQGDDASQGGGGLYNNGGTLLVGPGTMVTNNSATGESGSGGGILNTAVEVDEGEVAGTLRINDATISNNTANRAGGGIEDASGGATMVFIINSRIDSNEAVMNPGSGGGIHVGGDGMLSITRGSVSGNIANFEGGGLWNGTGMMVVTDTKIADNLSTGDAPTAGGGGIYNQGGMLKINKSTSITGNMATGTSGSGGGINNATGGRLVVNDATISSNMATRAGGGIEDASGSGSLFFVINSRIDSNTVAANPGNGGGIHVGGDGNLLLVRGSVSNNTAALEGGGVWNGAGLTRIVGTLVQNNNAQGDDATTGGGGVYNDGGEVEIGKVTQILDNSASGESGSGGGIFNALGGTLTVNDATISGNSANRAGGGIESAAGELGTTFIINARITENTTGSNPGNGGGIHIGGDGDLLIVRTLVDGNTAASEGGGLWNGMGETRVDGGTITNNTAAGATATEGGGGIYNDGGQLIVENGATISGNQATGTAGSGGGDPQRRRSPAHCDCRQRRYDQ